jgi:manganese transport protein
MSQAHDAYSLQAADIKEPPTSLWQSLRYLGPSLIVTANIVGSGELIMTTTLGATAGFVTLWVVLISCLVKVTVQLEFGKLAISSGETTLQSFNKLPGPRFRGVSWSLWVWYATKLVQFIQYGGIVGGVALALHMAFPGLPVWFWAWVAGLGTALMVYKGHYKFIEGFAVSLTAFFSLFTVVCVVLLQSTSYAVSLSDVAAGMQFQLPAAVIGVALAAFGITGVSADEIISYPYWCVEKGYARYAGKREQTAEWERRARGWIRVMYMDAVVSMIIYTLATAAFYVLGAAILHGSSAVPEGYDMIKTLSRIYTESIGPAGMWIFLTGSVVVLFSTLFVACASQTRMFTDAFAQCGVLDFSDSVRRNRWFKGLAWFFPISWTMLFLWFQSPVFMVMAGALAVTALLLLVVIAAIVFRYRRLARALYPGRVYDVLLWISVLAILGVGVKSALSLI